MFKKTLSVFLATVLLITACSVGMVGFAANIDYTVQYSVLADALMNDHVRTLTNYKIANTTLENGAEGFDTQANGFAYEHRVTAADDAEGSILKAANTFYYIAENLISTQYGKGYYNPSLLLAHVVEKVKPFISSNTDEVYYEDFYGSRYYPTEEEIAEYNNAVSLIEANNAEVNERNLTQLRVYFIQKDLYSYYNVEAVLKYFMGNTESINAGNWYHRFVFVVETSIDTALQSNGTVKNYSSYELVTRTGVYEWDYARSYNDLKTKAYYAFKAPSAATVWTNYGSEFNLSKNSSNLTETIDGEEGITAAGQAKTFLIKENVDTTTMTYLNTVYNAFASSILVNSDPSNYASWDAKYVMTSDSELKADASNAVLAGYIATLGSTYSNDTLLEVFGDEIGNIVTAAYVLTPSDKMPSRTIYGKTITVSAATLDEIIYDMDGLVTAREGTDNARDALVAGKVATIVSMFFNTSNDIFKDSAVAGLEFSSLHELVGLLLQGLVFRDSIINMLVKLLYPLVVNLIEEKVVGAIGSSAIGNLVSNILTSVLNNNQLAIRPDTLASRLKDDMNAGLYKYDYTVAANILNAAGSNWDNVNFDALTWGVDDAPIATKGEVFLEGLTASLSGFLLLLITVLCGATENSARKNSLSWLSDKTNQFTSWYSKLLINIGQNGVLLRSQGLYCKLLIPLYRILGLTEIKSYNVNGSAKLTGYLTTELYESSVDAKGTNALTKALEPIIYWVTDILGSKPFETLWNVLPNLVYFFIRVSDVSINDDWAEVTNDDYAHHDFDTVQTKSISTILDHVYLDVTLLGGHVYKSSILAFLPENIKGWLSDINKLLNGVLKLEYNTGMVDHEEVAAYAKADYSEIVLPDSAEYAQDPDAYPVELMSYWTDPTGKDIVAEKDDTHETEVKNIVYITRPYQLPQIQEMKLVSCGNVRSDWNTIVVDHPGVVLLYILRFVFTALGYKYNNATDPESDDYIPMLIDCFGFNIDIEVFQGFNVKDIIYNVMLHPDEAIWALLEVFYSHEDGDYLTDKAYTYDVEEINYHNATLLNTSINPTLTYGTKVRYTKYWTQEYAQDVVSNADDFVTNILIMLGMTDFADGIGVYLQRLLNENVFTNKIVNLLFNKIYQLLGGLNTTTGIDIETILDAALDVSYSTSSVATALYNMTGETEAYSAIYHASSWTELFTIDYTTNEDNEQVPVTGDITLDWGIDDASADDKAELFCKTLSALLSPVAFVFRYLLLDENMDILSLVKLPAYAGYQYAVIGLLEALGCPNILTYKQYADKCNPAKDVNADANTIYCILTPILGLLEKVYEAPVDTLLTMLPNLLFIVSIGGLNDIVNNFVHFAYVIIDVLKPIVNAYDILDGLLANIEIGGLSINLSLPLDIDFNALVSDVISTFVGDALEINGVKINLPYIDFHTLCCGTLSKFSSKELRTTVHLDSAGGGDMITALLRLVFDTLFMDENEETIALLVASAAKEGNTLDGYDTETMVMLVDELFSLMQTYDVPDMLLFVVYFLLNKLTPISGTLASRFAATGMSIQSLVASATDVNSFLENVAILAGANGAGTGGTTVDEETQTLSGFSSLIARIKEFFLKVQQFFKNMFRG